MLASNQTPGDPGFYDFSFSGLKTSVLNRVTELDAAGRLGEAVDDLAASFQAAVIDVLAAKTKRAVDQTGFSRVVLGGGVAASRALRAAIAEAVGPEGSVHFPSARLATDNAAMVASAAAWHFDRGAAADEAVTARADLSFPGLSRPAPVR
jgi:N6-L-threonylcarbamoyladenine synthase